MKIGFIVGKDDEIYDDEYLYSLTPKKYLVDGNLNTDVAIAISVLGLNLLGDGLRDIVDPRLARKR